jgi:hypothetical protein
VNFRGTCPKSRVLNSCMPRGDGQSTEQTNSELNAELGVVWTKDSKRTVKADLSVYQELTAIQYHYYRLLVKKHFEKKC